jgi:predicted alpha/beta-fold hydrolase
MGLIPAKRGMKHLNFYLPYCPPKLLFNAHLETIYPSLFRKVKAAAYVRERITTSDGDFLDLDWMKHTSAKLISEPDPSLVIISHGLEGNTQRAYVRGMARAFHDAGIDVLAWNFRSCGEEMNHTKIFYHSGASGDLAEVITHAISLNAYARIFLIGFSLGGNLTLKYLGERGDLIPPQVKKAVVFSVPMDLTTGSTRISEPANWIYEQRFLRSLKKKIITKAAVQPDLATDELNNIKTLGEFDNRYTAPLHGFKDASEYYSVNSANRFVTNSKIPTLIINAKNDPFLSPECYPVDLLKDHPLVTLEIPLRGGHVGFTLFNSNGLYWSELRALEFIQR